MSIDQALAVSFFVNAPAIAESLPAPPAEEAGEVMAVAEALRRLPRERLPELLADLIPPVLAAKPELTEMLTEVNRRQTVRGASEVSQLLPVVDYVMNHVGSLATIIVGLRLLGQNRIKIGNTEISTSSVLNELAKLVKTIKS